MGSISIYKKKLDRLKVLRKDYIKNQDNTFLIEMNELNRELKEIDRHTIICRAGGNYPYKPL